MLVSSRRCISLNFILLVLFYQGKRLRSSLEEDYQVYFLIPVPLPTFPQHKEVYCDLLDILYASYFIFATVPADDGILYSLWNLHNETYCKTKMLSSSKVKNSVTILFPYFQGPKIWMIEDLNVSHLLYFWWFLQVLFNGVLENACNEQGARMSAIDSSSRNVIEMLDKISLT